MIGVDRGNFRQVGGGLPRGRWAHGQICGRRARGRGIGERLRIDAGQRGHDRRGRLGGAGRRARHRVRRAHLHGQRLDRLPPVRREHVQALPAAGLAGQAGRRLHQLGRQARRQVVHPALLPDAGRPARHDLGQPGPEVGLELLAGQRARHQPARLPRRRGGAVAVGHPSRRGARRRPGHRRAPGPARGRAGDDLRRRPRGAGPRAVTVTENPVVRPRSWAAVLGVAVLAQTVAAMDSSVLNLAVKTLAGPVAGLGAGTGELAWAISAYTVVYAAAMFAGGALADRFGPRWALGTGLVVFMVTSALAAFSATPLELVLCRGGMGVGAALITPATLSVARRASDPARRPKAVAIWASASAVGIAIGPIVGGLLLSRLWWGSVFLLNVPVTAICLVGLALWVPRLHVDQRRPLDWPGLALSFGGLLGLVYGVIQIGGDVGWDSPSTLVPLVAGIVLLAAFAVW